MYKDEVRKALLRIALTQGGAVQGLLTQIQAAEPKLRGTLEEIAANNDTSVNAGRSHLQEAVRPIARQLQDISPSATAVELHELGRKFDLMLEEYPLLEGLLRPGRQALAKLAGAFDVVLQNNKNAPSITGLLAPGAALITCYEHYEALGCLFTAPVKGGEADQSLVVIELDGVDRLGSFADYMALLSRLADIGKWVIEQIEQRPDELRDGIWIASIESGSPVRISVTGDSKAIRLLLAMVRDVVRLPYLHLTRHGRALQAMETLARARELGVTSDTVLDKLNNAVVLAADDYVKSFRHEEVGVTIDGQPVQAVSLKYPVVKEIRRLDKSVQPKLQGPESAQSEE